MAGKIDNNINKPELFFGLVGPLGTDLNSLQEILEDELIDVGYKVKQIRLSALLHTIWKGKLPSREGPLQKYIEALQNAGDKFRKKCKLNDAFVYLCVAKIRELRELITGDPQKPAYGTAYIITSLKTPEEYERFNRIYGDAFFLIGTTRDREQRVDYLSKVIADSNSSTNSEEFRPDAENLITRDYKDKNKDYGQNVQDIFPLSSLFVNSNNLDEMKTDVNRFIRIIFGYPFHTPSKDEYMIYHAHASSLRSCDLSRQVGAAIGTNDGHLLTVGSNEVPKAFGGLYWPNDINDARDFKRGVDSNYEIKMNIISDLLQRLKDKKYLEKDLSRKRIKTIVETTYPYIKKADIMDIGEFGRTVHAEMAALLDAAYRGVSVKGANLFTTTFPCHNCTKHIIAAGIKEVIYIEPYPKSKAFELHKDAIQIDKSDDDERISFRPFVGISPRSYLKSFTKIDRKDNLGRALKWSKHNAVPKILDFPEYSYIPYEVISIIKLNEIKKNL